MAMKAVAGMSNPLVEACLVRTGARLAFRYHGAIVDPIRRQLLFDFERYDRPNRPESATRLGSMTVDGVPSPSNGSRYHRGGVKGWLGIAEEVTFYGSIADTDEMLALLRGAAVLVYPTEREGFGLVAAEALALGVPVVTSSCETNEARRLVDDGVTGSIVQPGDVEGFTAAVAGWLDHEGHAAIRTQFFAAHPDVDWSNMAISYRGVLNRVVEV